MNESWLSLPVGALGGWCWLLLHYVVVIVEFCAGLPFASLQITTFHPVWIFIYYLVLGGLFWWFRLAENSPSGNGSGKWPVPEPL